MGQLAEGVADESRASIFEPVAGGLAGQPFGLGFCFEQVGNASRNCHAGPVVFVGVAGDPSGVEGQDGFQ